MNDEPVHVVTDHGDPAMFSPHRLVRSRTHLPLAVDRPGTTLGQMLAGLPRAALEAWSLWRTARRQRGTTAIVTQGCSLQSYLCATLQAICRPLCAPRTHVVFDLLLEPRRSGLGGLFDSWKAWAFRHGKVRAVVWGAEDGENFAREYGLPLERFRLHSFYSTLTDSELKRVEQIDLDPGDDGFIFAGGNNGRDYPTLIAALSEVDYPIVVATTDPTVPPLAEGLDHVTVRGVSPVEFRRLMSRCTLFVEAHPAGAFRTAGHQSLLNAMKLEKPIVLADRRSARGLLEDEVEGLVVEAGDVEGLARAVRTLLEHPDRRRRMAARGRARLDDPIYAPDLHLQSIYNFALGLEHARLGKPGEPAVIELYGPAEASGIDPRSRDVQAGH
jgi:glycosyltransferase involved in cell wall biosynthesis